MARIVLIYDERDGITFATDDPHLSVYSVHRYQEDGETIWTEVFRSGPLVDRVLPITLDRIIGDTDQVGHFGDMADAIRRADEEEASRKRKADERAYREKLKAERREAREKRQANKLARDSLK